MMKGIPRRRASDVRKYVVRADLQNVRLAKAMSALTLGIYRHGEKIGQLEVGRGSLYWRGARRQKEKRISWGRFAEMMDKLAYGAD